MRFKKEVLIIYIMLISFNVFPDYIPYPIIMIHGRGDTSQFWNYHGGMPGFRQYMQQYYPLELPNIQNPKFRTADSNFPYWSFENLGKHLYSYSVSDPAQRAVYWIEEIYHRDKGKLGTVLVTNQVDENNNSVTRTVKDIYPLIEIDTVKKRGACPSRKNKFSS
ncbi:MAG: hypothetical protein N3E50_03650 [Candidatus Goldbacteria bacterium]|nr:hypothetical protein [Candidatus Goldiibacteriota bacterium]